MLEENVNTEVLSGVNILIKGTNNYTHTHSDGVYAIKAKVGDILVFSFLGMKTSTVTVGTSGTINVEMTVDEQQLDDIVVTAMGVSKSTKSIGYSVQELSGTELNKGFNNDFAGALQGKLAGVQIIPSSGAPGASSQIIIRGARSFTGNNTPLYVIDGMPVASQPDFSTGDGAAGADIANRAGSSDYAEIGNKSSLFKTVGCKIYRSPGRYLFSKYRYSNRKCISFYENEGIEAYNDIRRLKAMGNADLIPLVNPKPDLFPKRFGYGNSDVFANKNVREAFGDGSYVYREDVWWAGGTR